MATPVFAGYLIKRIDEARCPTEYNLSEGEEGNSYTVYLRLKPFKTKETGPFDVPPDSDSELRQFWGKSLKEHVRRAIENNENLPFSDVEYSENEDGGLLVVHGTTLKKTQADQVEAERKRWSSCLEKLMLYPNNAMKDELNRRHGFRAKAAEIFFQEDRQTGR